MKASLKNFVGRLHVLWHRQDQPGSSSSLHTSSTNEKGQKGSSSRGRQFLLPEEEENDVHSHRVSPTSSRSGRDTPPGSGIKGQFATCKDNELTDDDDENPSSHFLGGHAAKNSVRSIHQRQKECHFRKHDTFELTQKGATAYANSSYRPHVPLEDQSSSVLASSEYDDDEEDNCGNDPRTLMDTKASRQDAAILLSHRSHPDRK